MSKLLEQINGSDFKKTTLLFFVFETVNYLVIILSNKYIAYLGFFPNRLVLLSFKMPFFIYNLGNFDGLHYINIARNGYQTFEQAFFPFYPIVIRFLSPLFGGNGLVAALIISSTSLYMAIYILIRILKKLKFDNSQISWFLLFLLCFPTSFYFQAAYTESMFLLFICIYLISGVKKHYVSLVLIGFLSGITRLIAAVIFLPFLFKITDYRARFLYFFTPLVGLISYCIYLWKTTGDPIFFLNSQRAFGANRSSHIVFLPQVIYRYLKIFITANHTFQYFISILEFGTFMFVFLFLIYHLTLLLKEKRKNMFLIGLCLFSLANILLPTLTGTFSSIPRYALLSLSVFIVLSQIRSDKIKYIILCVFILLHIILLGFFSQGYFIS